MGTAKELPKKPNLLWNDETIKLDGGLWKAWPFLCPHQNDRQSGNHSMRQQIYFVLCKKLNDDKENFCFGQKVKLYEMNERRRNI